MGGNSIKFDQENRQFFSKKSFLVFNSPSIPPGPHTHACVVIYETDHYVAEPNFQPILDCLCSQDNAKDQPVNIGWPYDHHHHQPSPPSASVSSHCLGEMRQNWKTSTFVDYTDCTYMLLRIRFVCFIFYWVETQCQDIGVACNLGHNLNITWT